MAVSEAAQAGTTMSDRIRNEAILAGLLLAFGLFILPVAIYFVGQQIIGEYEGNGAVGLVLALWSALVRADGVAWILVLSPYLVIQLLRLTWKIWRRA